MKKSVVLLLVIFMSVPVLAAAIVIDLSGLTGDYSIGANPPGDAPWTRSMSFSIPDSVVSIDGLRFVVSGPWTNGMIETCYDHGGFTNCDTLTTDTKLTFRLTADTLGACDFRGAVWAYNWVSGSDLLVEVCSEGQVDVNQLLGTEITAELFCDVEPETLPRLVGAAFGTLNEVRLEMVGSVAILQPTWGSLKSQYR